VDIDLAEREPNTWIATIRDDEYAGLMASFEYEAHGLDLILSGFSVSRDPDAADVARVEEIRLYQIRRDLPIGVWGRAAQLEVVLAIESREQKRGGGTRVVGTTSSESGTPRLQEVAIEYHENIRQAVPEPVLEIARRHGVKPETARSWVHRARTKGYLGPAEAGKAGVSRRKEASKEEPSERKTKKPAAGPTKHRSK
jgi:hypothetical protein